MLSEYKKQDLLRTAIDMINEIDMINGGLSKSHKQLLRLQETVIQFPATCDTIGPITDIETQVANIVHTLEEALDDIMRILREAL